jgi:hypothetical protein
MAFATSFFIVLLISTENLSTFLGGINNVAQLSSLNLSAAWLTVCIIAVYFLIVVGVQIVPVREGRNQASIFTDLGASRQTILGLYFLKATLYGFSVGLSGFLMACAILYMLCWSWNPRLYLFGISVILVASATLVSNIYFLKNVSRRSD